MNNFDVPDRIEQAIREKGVYAGKTEGNSMEPMLVQGRDTVIVKKAEFPLKKYDVPVYHRGGGYVMHRIVKVTRDGYVICGDNRILLERDVTEADIVGVLAAFYHAGEYVEYGSAEYMRYAKRAVRGYPIRYIKGQLMRGSILKRGLKKIFRMRKNKA